MKRTFWILWGIIITIFFLSVLMVNYTSTTIAPPILSQEYDVIIIPGQGVTDGILLKDAPQRLDYVITVFAHQKVKPKIIVSGYGRGYVARNQSEIEAHLMSEYLAPQLEQQGFDPQKVILIENQSHHTVENALYTKRLLSLQEKKVLVLAAPKAHYRNKLIFSALFDQEVQVYSLRPQTSGEKIRDIPRTIGTLYVLVIPGEERKLWMSRFLFLNIVGERCSEATWMQKVFCMG